MKAGLFRTAVLMLLAGVCSSCADVVNEKEIMASDMVLIYSGGAKCSVWDKEHFSDYVSYTDMSGKSHWLFDGFLFLCLWDAGAEGSPDVAFCWNYDWPCASRRHWERLLSYYFRDDHGIGALECAVSDVVPLLGKPPYKREVVMAIPYPSEYLIPSKKEGGSTYWGDIDGKKLDFSRLEDRFEACKWYIGRVLEEFGNHDYRYVGLKGFYWLHEETEGSDEKLIRMVAEYLRSLGYPLSWIPWFHAPGYDRWKELGFKNCWEQPNYFFNDYCPYECLSVACDDAKASGMGVEMEFDERVLKNQPWGEHLSGHLRDYMKVFMEEGAWEGLPIAYYQSLHALRDLKLSDCPDDNELYHEFCGWVVSRPYRQRNVEK